MGCLERRRGSGGGGEIGSGRLIVWGLMSEVWKL